MMTVMANRKNAPAPGTNPKPRQIKAAREAAGLTQTEAAELVYSTLRTWQDWEAEGQSQRRMHPAIWELWCRKVAEPKKKK